MRTQIQILFLILLLLSNAQLSSAQFTEVYPGDLTGVWSSRAVWGDYDNDGDLDILLTGYDGISNLSSVYENNGSGFSEDITASSVLTGVIFSSTAWGDYDNDGDLDILMTG